MKKKLVSISLFVVTAGVIGLYPIYQSSQAHVPAIVDNRPVQTQAKKIELVFVLDTTGSMSGLIKAAKEKIWSIATNMAQAESAPEIRIGLVGFRDRGDEYVTRKVDLSTDLDSVYAQLMDFTAAGGGDTPESVNQALSEAVNDMTWSKGQDVYKAIFLVGDAPPHMDYQDDVKYPQSIKLAQSRGIMVNTIQCGNDHHTLAQWQSMANLSGGAFFNVAQNGNAVAISTPFDEKLARLSSEMDATRMYYGNKEEKAAKQAKVDATQKLHEAASVESRARRAMYNATASGKANETGEGDLLADIQAGSVSLETVPQANLPAPLAARPREEQQRLLKETSEKREALRSAIAEVAQQRTDYIAEEMKKRGGAKESLDDKLIGTLRAQAKEKGLDYDNKPVIY